MRNHPFAPLYFVVIPIETHFCVFVYVPYFRNSLLIAHILKQPKWRSDIYHVDWNSIALIHSDKEAFNTLSESDDGFL